ncbi:MAG: hypothetical protein WC773_02685 [Patescibacteria group bacterium]|jgi:hypothetical protein
MPEVPDRVRVVITWQKNERWNRKPGSSNCVAAHGNVIVFPSDLGYIPPEDSGAVARKRYPVVGDSEDCILVPGPSGKTYFAFPVMDQGDVVEVIVCTTYDIDGNVLTLADGYRLGGVTKSPDGRITIVLNPTK